jgi:hypothetical protein
MPLNTANPEVAVPAQNANSWRISHLFIETPLTGNPSMRITVVAEMVDGQGNRTFVTQSTYPVPDAVLQAAMSAVTDGKKTVYETVRDGAYAMAQAMGVVPADATYSAS